MPAEGMLTQDVLIVGEGPGGLTLAIDLGKLCMQCTQTG